MEARAAEIKIWMTEPLTQAWLMRRKLATTSTVQEAAEAPGNLISSTACPSVHWLLVWCCNSCNFLKCHVSSRFNSKIYGGAINQMHRVTVDAPCNQKLKSSASSCLRCACKVHSVSHGLNCNWFFVIACNQRKKFTTNSYSIQMNTKQRCSLQFISYKHPWKQRSQRISS